MTVLPSLTVAVDAMTPSQSREAALHGHRALTPILSGAISGGIVGVAWIIGIIVWLFKRHRRAQRAKAAGYRSHREFLDPPKKDDAFIIPPDPAVIKGHAKPGQRIVVEDVQMAHMKHARTVPEAAAEDGERRHGEKEDVPPGMAHRTSAPCRVQDSPNPSNYSGREREKQPLVPPSMSTP
ncbi:hypothetical protein C2E23DRAFT_801493 [Lenzites betulinus]|nr:hypothetical protein C2E23DRAFT_801493 [Lenzites betulinus]